MKTCSTARSSHWGENALTLCRAFLLFPDKNRICPHQHRMGSFRGLRARVKDRTSRSFAYSFARLTRTYSAKIHPLTRQPLASSHIRPVYFTISAFKLQHFSFVINVELKDQFPLKLYKTTKKVVILCVFAPLRPYLVPFRRPLAQIFSKISRNLLLFYAKASKKQENQSFRNPFRFFKTHVFSLDFFAWLLYNNIVRYRRTGNQLS